MRLVLTMTRFLLALLIIGLFALAMLGACLEVVERKASGDPFPPDPRDRLVNPVVAASRQRGGDRA